VNGKRSTIFFSTGPIPTSSRKRDPARGLSTDDLEIDDAYWNDAEVCGVSRPADVNENVVAL
jgi:hypothetical protein